ncbi:MAG: ABC transporter permease [Clostridia bacterium]|nr:ABC transporter permease [Clostridia bacterium]
MTQDAAENKSSIGSSVKKALAKAGITRLIIFTFFIVLCIMADAAGISVPSMLGFTVKRAGMYGVMALAMLPAIQCGIGLNLGMTLGVLAGLVSTLLCIEYGLTGWPAFLFSAILGSVIALPVGYLYGKLLNKLKGSEMTVSTYVGFSIVSLLCVGWMLFPFKNNALTYALGPGLRPTHNMNTSYGALLNNFMAFRIGKMTIPTGMVAFFLLCCFGMWLFSRSKTGTAMIAAGSNPRFAEAAGINVDQMRMIGTILSTVIAAVGIVVYQQGYGFLQLYQAPRQMGFIAASAILIGGASVTKAKVSHVIIGVTLFQGLLTLGIQVANKYVPGGGMAEAFRIIISNGIILYALATSGGASRE